MRKKRIEKKAEKLRRKRVHEILEMVLEINGTYPREKKLTGDKTTAFFEFSGHIATADVILYRNGWDGDSLSDAWLTSHIDEEDMRDLKGTLEDIMEELRRVGKM